ncbi:MAG: winged helix-turn-helix domain-containing protein [Nitrososphaerota archaeon]|nr:winged helix-turn-helix domain-containing protein [Nitrososphaerota archaeon]
MPSLSAVRRRNQDYLLIETIKQVGISNYSMIARLTGLNAETVRYRVTKHLSRLGLEVKLNVNYGELGFSSAFLSMTAEGTDGSWLDGLHYLVLSGKVVGMEKYYCVSAVPLRLKKKYFEMLDSLTQKEVLGRTEAMELDWIRYPTFRSEFYDFVNGRWKVDWSRVELVQNEMGVTTSYIERDGKVDRFDVQILRSMQEEPTVSIAKIAKKMGMNARTVRYHHLQHVTKRRMVLNNTIRWTLRGQVMQAVFIFRSLDRQEAPSIRKIFNRLPFTWLEGGKDEGGYAAFLDIPMESFHDTIKHVETKLAFTHNKPEVILLDASKTKYFGLETELFDKKWGWSLPGYQPNLSAVVGEGPDDKDAAPP